MIIKLKENINLEDLEKIGFEKRYDTKTGEVIKYIFRGDEDIVIYLSNSYFEYNGLYEMIDLEEYSEALYLLTKNNYVEMIKEDI